MADYTNNNGCLDWNDAIETDGQEFITLPEGDYIFTVTGFERGRFPGSTKIPACNKAVLTLDVTTPQGTAKIHTDLILHKSLEWKLSSFFRCIGMKKHGERLVMDWSKVQGSTGKAHVIVREYTSQDGSKRTVNDVTKFLDPVTEPASKAIPKRKDPTPTETIELPTDDLPF